MGKLFSSSHQSKPLLILSLVASLLLHGGGFYFLIGKETSVQKISPLEHAIDLGLTQAFKTLLIQEDVDPSFSSPNRFPHLEPVTPPLLTKTQLPPELFGPVKTPSYLTIDSYIPPLMNDPYLQPKNYPFSGKKWINFNRNIAKEHSDLFKPLLVANQNNLPPISKPNFEKNQERPEFTKESLSSFNLTLLPPSTLQPIDTKEKISEFLYPNPEKDSKCLLDDNINPSHLEKPTPAPFVFKKAPMSHLDLYLSTFTPSQKSWNNNNSSLDHADLPYPVKHKQSIVCHPQLEGTHKLSFFDTPLPPEFHAPSHYSDLLSYESSIDLNFSRPPLIPHKKSIHKGLLTPQPPKTSIYTPTYKVEKTDSQITYHPHREPFSIADIEATSSYLYSYNIETDSLSALFNFSPDILPRMLNTALTRQKESSPFLKSALSLQDPYFYAQFSDFENTLKYSPTKEASLYISQLPSSIKLELEIQEQFSNALFSTPSSLAALPLIPYSLDSSHQTKLKPLKKHLSALTIASPKMKITQKETPILDRKWNPSIEKQHLAFAFKTMTLPSHSFSINTPPPSLDTMNEVYPQLHLQTFTHAKNASFSLHPQESHLILLNPPSHLAQKDPLNFTSPKPTFEHSERPLIAERAPSPLVKYTDGNSERENIKWTGAGTQEMVLPPSEKSPIHSDKYATSPPQMSDQPLLDQTKLGMVAKNSSNFKDSDRTPAYLPQISPISHSSTSVTNQEFPILQTQDIYSLSKEIIEDYYQEARASSATLALSQPKLQRSPPDSQTFTLNQSHRWTRDFLEEIPSPSSLQTLLFQNEFDTEVHYTPKQDGEGYLFALKMKPTKRLQFDSPSQNVIFVLDGSNSVKKDRFNAFKNGVIKALPYMRDGDSFNVLIANTKLTPMHEKALPFNKQTSRLAKNFLRSHQYRGFFINYNAFDLISRVSTYFDPDKENVIVLMTDGQSLNSLKHHKDDFLTLATTNPIRFSIFTASASQDNNLTMLDLVSTFNQGELMYSKTNAAFPRKLAVLMKHIESFLAKDIHIGVASQKIEKGIEFYPNEKTLPSLYSDQPYMVFGSIDELKDFDLLLQGKAGDQWINVRQHISFKNAKKATHAMKRALALQQAYVCYDDYLQNKESDSLSKTELFLTPHTIPTAFR